jgi:iron complex outermembrane receptor protein
LTKEGATQKRDIYQAGVEDEITLWGNRVMVSPQILYTYLKNDFGGRVPFQGAPISSPDDEGFVSYKIGGKVQVADGLLFRANVGRFFRYPNFSELFGDRGFVIGNPDLKSEEAINTDVGFSFEKQDWEVFKDIALNRLFLEASYFFNTVDDLIVFEQTSQRTIRAVNISRPTFRESSSAGS